VTLSGEYSRDDVLAALEQVSQYGTPPRGRTRLLDVGSDHFCAYFERELINGLTAFGGATTKFVEGEYGSGKTHLLDLLHELAVDKGMGVVRADLTEVIGLQHWKQIVRHVLANLEAPIGGEVHRSLPAILDAIAAQGSDASDRLRRAALPHAGFVQAMRLRATDSGITGFARDRLTQFLLGESVTVTELRNAGIDGVRNSLTEKNAEQVLRTVLTGLSKLGLPGVLLLFDENERTFTFNRERPPERVVRGANLMRRFIDACAAGGLSSTVAVFFVLPGFVQNCALAYAALGQRLQRRTSQVDGCAWRWPTLSIADVVSHLGPEAFVGAAADRMCQLAEQCQPTAPDLLDRLTTEGHDVLRRHAGTGFRRPLMKRLATVTLQVLEPT